MQPEAEREIGACLWVTAQTHLWKSWWRAEKLNGSHGGGRAVLALQFPNSLSLFNLCCWFSGSTGDAADCVYGTGFFLHHLGELCLTSARSSSYQTAGRLTDEFSHILLSGMSGSCGGAGAPSGGERRKARLSCSFFPIDQRAKRTPLEVHQMRRAGIIKEPSDSRGKDCCNPVKWVRGSIPGVRAPSLSLLVNAQMYCSQTAEELKWRNLRWSAEFIITMLSLIPCNPCSYCLNWEIGRRVCCQQHNNGGARMEFCWWCKKFNSTTLPRNNAAFTQSNPLNTQQLL